jgi:hypothetical protein
VIENEAQRIASLRSGVALDVRFTA